MTADREPARAGEPRPMDPGEVTEIRAYLRGEGPAPWGDNDGRELAIAELLAHADYHERQAEFLARLVGSAIVRSGLAPGESVVESDELVAGHALISTIERLREHAEVGRQWQEDSSLERWFPLTAERLKEAEAEISRLSKDLADTLALLGLRRPQEAAAIIASIKDHHRLEAEVASLRSRVRVEAADCKGRVTKAHVETWLRSHGWRPSGERGRDGWPYEIWRVVPPDGRGVRVYATDDHGELAVVVRKIACHCDRPGLDILDEMAASEPSPAIAVRVEG